MWYQNIVTAEKHTSVIVALWLPNDKSKKLALKKTDVENPESAESLHITMLYIGKADALKDKRELIEAALEAMSNQYPAIKGKVQGVGCFSGNDETKPFYASYDSAELSEIRQKLVETMESLGIELDKTHGFVPHITLAYIGANDDFPNVDVPDLAIDFDKFTLAWAGKQTHYSLSKKS